ncbi:MAG: hypothetical protein R2822_16540 [Spirosomataceae bacterium]
MKKTIASLFGLLGIILILSPIHASSEDSEKVFYGNPLTLNGRPLDYTFSKSSRGVLALVKETPIRQRLLKFPLKCISNMQGKCSTKASSDTREHYQVEVSGILALAQYGDSLSSNLPDQAMPWPNVLFS